MSKSRGNVVNPDDVIAEYGADALRCYEMFMGPLEATKPWSMTGVEGVARFLARVWRLVMEENQAGKWMVSSAVQDVEADKTLLRIVHATVKKVGEDIEELSFNTAISQMMICTNALVGTSPRPVSAIRTLLLVLSPFSPHLAEELWERLEEVEGRQTATPHSTLIAQQPWPTYDPALLVVDEVEYPVQVNGKLRDKIVVSKDAPAADIEAAALALPKVAEHTAGKTIRKVIVVAGRLVNIVAN
jgi:leucyl-tRNA synthetase